MRENLKNFVRYLYAYKFYGLVLYAQVYWFRKSSVSLKDYGKFYLRRGTCDGEVFTQMFVHKQYNVGIDEDVKVVVDLGGNNGMSAVYFSKRFPKAKIYVLEPDKENFKMLQKHVAGIDNIVPINKAIWKENGTVNLTTGETWAIRIDENGDNMAEAITMDNLMSTYGINSIDVLKIDIESAEKELFESSTSFLSKTRNLIIELHDWMRPGCAAPFFRSLSGYSYNYTTMHENTMILGLQAR
jgi:FkbM family methyltransferase